MNKPLVALAVLLSGAAAAHAAGPHRRSSGQPLSVTAALGGSRVLQGGDGATHLLVEVEAPRVERGTRPPLNVALVLDRSGSMAGEKLANAVAASRRFVEGLADGDRVALVVYDSTVETLVPSTGVEGGRRRVAEALSRVRDMGGTNLGAGLAEGIRQAMAGRSEQSVNNVVLLSDGQANEGVTDPGQLAQMAANALQFGVTLTSIGLGLDFNEQLMMALAQRGRGGYHYIRDAGDLAEGFASRLLQLESMVARDVVVEVTPGPGVEVGDAYVDGVERTAGRLRVRLGDLYGGRVRKVVFPVSVPSGSAGLLPVAKVEVSYSDALHGGHAVATRLDLGVEVLGDAGLVARSEDQDVAAKVATIRAAFEVDAALAQYRAGDAGGARDRVQKLRGEVADKQAVFGDDFLDGELAQLEVLEETLAEPPATSSAKGKDLLKSYQRMVPSMAE